MSRHNNDYPELSAKEKERQKRREKKRRPEWKVSGRGVFTLAQIVKEKIKGEKPLESKRKGSRTRPKKK